MITPEVEDGKELDMKFQEMKKGAINNSSSAKLVNQGQ